MAATAGARHLDLVRGLGADDVIDCRWDASPFPSEAINSYSAPPRAGFERGV
jgi:hypothetical protein